MHDDHKQNRKPLYFKMHKHVAKCNNIKFEVNIISMILLCETVDAQFD